MKNITKIFLVLSIIYLLLTLAVAGRGGGGGRGGGTGDSVRGGGGRGGDGGARSSGGDDYGGRDIGGNNLYWIGYSASTSASSSLGVYCITMSNFLLFFYFSFFNF